MRYYITERHEAHIYDYNVRKINIVTSEDQSETRKLKQTLTYFSHIAQMFKNKCIFILINFLIFILFICYYFGRRAVNGVFLCSPG